MRTKTSVAGLVLDYLVEEETERRELGMRETHGPMYRVTNIIIIFEGKSHSTVYLLEFSAH